MSGISHRVSQQRYFNRSRDQVARFFAGTELVEPGLVRVENWRPEPGGAGGAGGTRSSALWGAVGRKPAVPAGRGAGEAGERGKRRGTRPRHRNSGSRAGRG